LKRYDGGTEPEPRSICILRLSSIGDVIQTLPVADLIKRRYPASKLTWVAEKGMAPLLRNHPAIDQLLLIDTKEWRRKFFSPAVWKEIRGFLRYLRSQEFDVALDFQGLFKSAILAAFTGARRRIGMSRYDRHEKWSSVFLNEFTAQTSQKSHIIEKNLALLERLDISGNHQALNFHLEPDDESKQYVNEELERLELKDFWILNPGGGWITKLWDVDKWAQLIDCVYNDLNLPVLILWGPGEKHLADRIERKTFAPATVSFSTTLPELIALCKKGRLMVSGDTGPLHLASALGVPVVGLFGPTDPNRNGPWNPHDSTCTIRYECSPCYQQSCPIGIQCMKKLEVPMVLDAVKRTYNVSSSLDQHQ